MNNAIAAACGALALAGTMTVSAQTPTPAPPVWPLASAPGAMTLTGCLKPWGSTMGAAPAGAMDKPGAMMAGPRYVLANIETERPIAGGAVTAPTPGTPTPGAHAHPVATQYLVVGSAGVDLAPHANHQVRVTGTLGSTHTGMGGMMPADKPMTKPHELPAPRPGDAPKLDHMGMGHMGMDHKGADHGLSTLTASAVTMISAACTTTP